ncbi:Planctomycete cytochrome C [Thalassoglobus neptunius]|uniref:Planctomycete cytochrome C n=1 Tax=Thalassoglobus neptunius TaxID=1938619 RepID=A0A5C5VAM0_9PLAN|nr:PSD1 and planctomycete cytochrome C domain-containing protein [Thalassoglobus neptunius]TWT35040.1 Planctomycete cytochrome C [Thalassoglobus neptunius]
MGIPSKTAMFSSRFAWLLIASGIASGPLSADQTIKSVKYNRDIRPLLADACLNCHGQDEQSRQADLRLDRREDVLLDRGGYSAIVPGDAENSEVVRRILSEDAFLQMPPPDSPRQLTDQERAMLLQWIEDGAEFEQHWSFIPPELPTVPEDNTGWSRNEIDRFVLRPLKDNGLKPQDEADCRTLIRRVTLDLTGLPPTRKQVEQFLADTRPDAYERLVDTLLASPQYGEQQASMWLDLARYADSGGYQGDIPRTMWPWRDWVIQAYNKNLPFDKFTLYQLAGDLLPNPSDEQLIATGFNRNHRINDEDGIIPEEFRMEYVVDRVETTSLTWMGLTMGCARCHDHKFDPISQEEFYSFLAYFNSVDEFGRGYGNAQPLFYYDPETQAIIERIDRELIELGDAAQGEYQKLIDLKAERDEVLSKSLTVMIMKDLPEPRETFILDRGLYDSPGKKVEHGVPAAILPLSKEVPRNRLSLAKWLTDPQHPLTSRVAVNRYWKSHFGRGLVSTPEDFGTRGAPPSHPELLDWLAVRFISSGWDVKALHRLIVTSSTYRQDSSATKEQYLRDPENRLLSRGPRVRMRPEEIRDQALSASGLLNSKVGGPSVKPYQPDGVWEEMVAFFPEYNQSHGEDLYRRSLYTFLRRTVQPPNMNSLDFQSREICQVNRPTTNTPLQALVLMNDPTYVEAARVLAQQTMLTCPSSSNDELWLTDVLERILIRPPTCDEIEILKAQLHQHRNDYRSRPELAQRLMTVGESPIDSKMNPVELAARTVVVSLIFNVDEAINRE